MQVRKLDPDNRQDRKKFIQFPFDLYRSNPYWVPPIQGDMETVMNRIKHPFYQHSNADFFVVESDDQVLGRVAMIHNRNYCNFHKEKVAFFYYYDAVDDFQVSSLLLQAGVDWARAQGLDTILGPKGFLRSQGFGILIEGFDQLPAVGIPYNFPYYDAQLTRFGFRYYTDHISGCLTPSGGLPEKAFAAAEKIKETGNFRVLQYKNKAEMRKWIPKVNQVHHEAFKDNPNYYPSTEAEFELMARNILRIADPRLIKIILKGDQIAGFLLVYPNICRALQRTNGKLWPFGWIQILWEMKTTRRLDFNGVGLLPEYQGRGANILLYVELEKTLRAYGAEFGDLVQVDVRNFRSKSDMETAGARFYKTHRTYILPLN
jgi:GNAT superfamily N-acetyltransferase